MYDNHNHHGSDAFGLALLVAMASLEIGRQLGPDTPTVVEVARFSERAFRMYFGAGGEGPFTTEQRDLINAVAIALLKKYAVVK